MNDEPTLRLYSDAHCISDRPELSAIRGQRVAIIARSIDENGKWTYTVSLNKTSPTIKCFESELVPADPVPFIPDDEFLENVVAQTANLRYSVKWDGLRQLLDERGYDPLKCLLISCDQGLDVNITLVLPDGTIIDADYREDSETRQATRFEQWQASEHSDREIELCREILASDTSHFDANVRCYFDERLSANDMPLPPRTLYNRG
ncbi:MAG: hypothetical protein K8T91_12400 [Planctomycetes bacterium]|nr:hypothetical protein [Planctomycetota bacterium]